MISLVAMMRRVGVTVIRVCVSFQAAETGGAGVTPERRIHRFHRAIAEIRDALVGWQADPVDRQEVDMRLIHMAEVLNELGEEAAKISDPTQSHAMDGTAIGRASSLGTGRVKVGIPPRNPNGVNQHGRDNVPPTKHRGNSREDTLRPH